MTAPIIETDLGKILERIEQKLDALQKDVTEIKVGQARLEERMTAVEGEVKEVKGEIKDLKASQRNQIWALIGILGTAVVATVIRFVITAMPAGKP